MRGGGQNRGTGDHLEPNVLEEEPPEADVTRHSELSEVILTMLRYYIILRVFNGVCWCLMMFNDV